MAKILNMEDTEKNEFKVNKELTTFRVIKEFESLKESKISKIAVKVVEVDGRKYLDIRKMWKSSSDTDWKYTQKGVMLDYEAFQLLMATADDISVLL